MSSLTSHLLTLDATTFQKATTHPFLTAAARGTLPLPKLKRWLAQDRLYALSYANFMGALLARVPIPTGADREHTLEWRVADALIDCLDNIRREMRMFEDVARQEGWMEEICGVETERETRCYQDLFAGCLAMGRGFIVGLVVLWGTEECYLRAWRFARGRIVEPGEGGGDVMRKTFIPNWSSSEFEQFVGRLRGLVDEMAREWNIEDGGWLWKECEAAWKQVVWAESEFWPEAEG